MLAISFVIIAYLVYQNRQLKASNTQAKQEKENANNNARDIHDNPDRNDASSYEQVDNEQSYTGLKMLGEDKNYDDLYGHLNEVSRDYANQEETGI